VEELGTPRNIIEWLILSLVSLNLETLC
jgi:hypothetical protein